MPRRTPQFKFLIGLFSILVGLESVANAFECSDAFVSIGASLQRSRDDFARVKRAAELLGISKLSDEKEFAVLNAHKVGNDETGRNGFPARPSNYSFRQILAKVRILKAADFDNSQIRVLMQNEIVGGVGDVAINAAILAEARPPTETVFVRESGELNQYAALDSEHYYGRRINVNFVLDRHNPGGREATYPVPQLVLTKDYLELAAQEAIATIKNQSTFNGGQFREVGVWVVYTDRGYYLSKTFTSNDPLALRNDQFFNGFEEAYNKSIQAEGIGVALREANFYHTHFEVGEAFSFGDLDEQTKFFNRRIRKVLSPGGNFAAYAVPIKGQAIFRSNLTK